MSPSHAVKNGVRYRYYVSQTLLKRGRSDVSDAACRVPAADLESLVVDRLCAMLKDPSAILGFAGTPTIATRKALIRRAADLATRSSDLSASERRQIFQDCIARVDLRTDTVAIAVRRLMLLRTVRGVSAGDRDTQPAGNSTAVLSIPARVCRTGLSTQMVIEGRSAIARQPNRSLLRLIGQALHFQDLVISKGGSSFRKLAAQVGVQPNLFHARLPTELPRARYHHGDPAGTPAAGIGRHPTHARRPHLALLGKAASSTWLRRLIAPGHERRAANTTAELLFAENRLPFCS